MSMVDPWPRRLIGVSLNAAIDKIAEVEHLRPGTIHRPTMRSVVPGGKALNAARSAAALGLSAAAVAVVAGHSGAWLEASLVDGGIRGWFVRVPGESRTCLSILDRETGELTEFYEAGVVIPEKRWVDVELTLASALGEDPAGALVLLAGSLPPGAPVAAYRRLAIVASDHGARVAVDIAGRPLRAALEAAPWLVKVNASEAAQTTGIATDDLAGVCAAAYRLRSDGAATVIVTMGLQGAFMATAGGDWLAGPPPERGPFSVGSGDALLAGFASGLSRGAVPSEALRTGVAAGAANALTPGQGVLDPADVARLASGCTVTEWKSTDVDFSGRLQRAQIDNPPS